MGALATILLVDDDPAAVGLMEAILEPMDEWRLITAASGVEAVAMAKAEELGVILLDRMLPDGDGIQICTQLKSDPATSSIPVVMVTGMDDGATRNAALAAGAVDVLTKPFSTVGLIQTLESILG